MQAEVSTSVTIVTKEDKNLRRKKGDRLNKKVRRGTHGLGIILYTGWTATSPCFMWRDAFEPFNEAFFTPDTLKIAPQTNERKVSAILQRQKTRIRNTAKLHLKKYECFIEIAHASYINPLNTKRRLLYLKTQFVPRSKHFSSRL